MSDVTDEVTDENAFDVFDVSMDEIEELPTYDPWCAGLYTGLDMTGKMVTGEKPDGSKYSRYVMTLTRTENTTVELYSEQDEEEEQTRKVGDITQLSYNFPPAVQGDEEASEKAKELRNKSLAYMNDLLGESFPDASNFREVIEAVEEGLTDISVELSRTTTTNKDDPDNPYINQKAKNFSLD